ncbi:MAG: glucuronate isomerase [Lachnospiraceae bacterium]|nr:glucuronate isomerase [Lachnospiraceae bacterium]
MRAFMDEDFLLTNDVAKKLYHDHAEKMPIVDYHNHLSPKEIYENKNYESITDAWLGGDHYKWRAMRGNGIDEEKITGSAASYDKFEAWASTIPELFGNPLYHWTGLELKRYFGIDTPFGPKTAKETYDKCNELLQKEDFRVRDLLVKMNVVELCTTDDPADSLEYHLKLKEEETRFHVRPSYRPEKAMGIRKAGYADYIKKLAEVAECEITDYDSLVAALTKRLDFFYEAGCRITDHSLEGGIYKKCTKKEADAIFKKRLVADEANAETAEDELYGLSQSDEVKFKGCLLTDLAKEYHKRDMVMQLHIGAMRNNSTRMFNRLGVDCGFDSEDDFNYAAELSALLDSADITGELPKTILYCLNPNDMEMLGSMLGNFQDGSCPGKIQLGPAWWFCDHKTGMERQMQTLMDYGVFSRFTGMLTDSRSFLSFSRHEYFRRILCNMVGEKVENGEYPWDEEFLGQMIENICYYNAKNYLGI